MLERSWWSLYLDWSNINAKKEYENKTILRYINSKDIAIFSYLYVDFFELFKSTKELCNMPSGIHSLLISKFSIPLYSQ